MNISITVKMSGLDHDPVSLLLLSTLDRYVCIC